jgi:hypothetical protein
MELIEEPIAAKIKNIGEAIAIASTYQEPSIELLRQGPGFESQAENLTRLVVLSAADRSHPPEMTGRISI